MKKYILTSIILLLAAVNTAWAQNVAKIGTTPYTSLAEAITEANAGETIELLANIDATAQILVDKKVTLDLNGHIIEYKGTSELKSGVIGVKRGGDLTIKDSSASGTGAIKSGNKAYAAVAMTVPGEPATGDAAKLTVNSGTLEGYYYAITGNGTRHDTDITINGGVIQGTYDSDNCGIFHPQDGTLTITGGTISGYSAAVELRSGTLNISGGTFTATCETYSCEPNGSGTTTKGAAIAIAQHTTNKAIEANITGGTFNVSGNGVKLSVANPQNNAFSNVTVKGLNTLLGESVTVPEGYAWKDNGDGTSSLAHVVAKIGTASYASLKDAIAAVPTDGTATTIELLTNINAEERTIIPSNTNITLDLGGFPLRCDDDFAIAFFDGAPGAVGPNKTQNAQLTVKSGTVTSKKSYAIRTDGTGNKLTIAEDATVKAGRETDYALVVRGSNTEVTVNGTVEVLSGTAISTNGNDATNNNSITINAPAKITSPDDDAIYMPSGALTVNGGTITGATGIYFKGKTLTIPASSTAVITGTGPQRAAHYNGNGGDWTGDALVVDNANYPSGDPVPSVAGGTFISTHALPIASYATGATATAPTKFVSGGRFGGKIPASVIVDDYICKLNVASGYYELELGVYVAEVESIGYETFEEAVTAAGNEKVITLLADITGTYTMHEGQTLKIYKNGKTITVVAPEGSELKESEEEIDGKTVTVYAVPSSMGTLIAEGISLPLQVIPDNTHLKPSMLKDIEVTDGGKTLVLGVHYTVVVKDKSGSTTYTEDAPITDDGIYQAVFQGLAPYYSNSIAKEMPVLFEYNHFAADDAYYNGHTSGYQIAEPVSIHVTSGKNLECQVGDKTGTAVPTDATSATLPGEAVFTFDDKTFTLKVVGIEHNAFDGAANLRYVEASQIKGFVPETLSREFDGPFKGLPKQALVYLAGTDIKGENYVYKPGDGDAYYCELFKIYDDLNGSQTGFSGNDYKWAFENPHAFTAYTVENTRMLTVGKHYTTCLPYALAIPSSMKAYTLDATSNQIFGFREVAGTMEAYTPYVLIPTASGQLLGTTNVVVSAFTATPNTDVTQLNGTTKGNFTMYGTMRYMEGNDAVGKYIMQYGMDHKPTWLSIDEAAAGFNESNRACILSMRAYIKATASPARSYTAVFTDIDGVIRTETFTPDEEDTVIYDLQGRRVQNVTHGRLYIINGKKVMVK